MQTLYEIYESEKEGLKVDAIFSVLKYRNMVAQLEKYEQDFKTKLSQLRMLDEKEKNNLIFLIKEDVTICPSCIVHLNKSHKMTPIPSNNKNNVFLCDKCSFEIELEPQNTLIPNKVINSDSKASGFLRVLGTHEVIYKPKV